MRFGEEVREVEYRKPVNIPQMEGTDQVLVKDFSKIIRKSRENRKLTQEDLAKKLSEKVSIIKRVEEGWHPSNKLLEKIEKFFDIKLMEDALEPVTGKRTTKRKLTIGDVVDVS